VQVVCVTSQGLIAKSGAGVVGLETSAQAEAVDDQIHLLWSRQTFGRALAIYVGLLSDCNACSWSRTEKMQRCEFLHLARMNTWKKNLWTRRLRLSRW